MKPIFKISLLVAFFSLILAGCSFSVNNSSTTAGPALGGVFVSIDKGDTWHQVVATPTVTGAPGTIGNLDVNELVIDPSDSNAVYLASYNEGLYYTYNIANGWRTVGTTLPKTTINDLAVDFKSKCTLFAAVTSKLYKSDDCGRSWKEVYSDTNPGVLVNAVAVDQYNSNQIYIGTSRGEVIKSLNAGVSWQTIQRLSDGVKKIVINPKDSRSVFVASAKSGLYRFNSNQAVNLDELKDYTNRFDGANWTNLNDSLKEFELGFNFKNLVSCSADNVMYMATDKVLLRSVDNGQSWAKLKLITPDAETAINTIAVNPKNSQEIFYVTNTTFYKSLDGGVTWSSKQLPTARAGWSLAVDFQDPNNIYLGIKTIKN